MGCPIVSYNISHGKRFPHDYGCPMGFDIPWDIPRASPIAHNAKMHEMSRRTSHATCDIPWITLDHVGYPMGHSMEHTAGHLMGYPMGCTMGHPMDRMSDRLSHGVSYGHAWDLWNIP